MSKQFSDPELPLNKWETEYQDGQLWMACYVDYIYAGDRIVGATRSYRELTPVEWMQVSAGIILLPNQEGRRIV